VGLFRASTVLEFLRQGDVLMVTRIDRLARSIGDLHGRLDCVNPEGKTWSLRYIIGVSREFVEPW
jgi:hypothetical protein